MKNNYAMIAEIFKNRRIELGLSKRKLACLVGISDTELSRIEHGERENYNLITLIKLCDVLDLDFIKLLVAAKYLKHNDVQDGETYDDELEEEEIEEPLKISITIY